MMDNLNNINKNKMISSYYTALVDRAHPVGADYVPRNLVKAEDAGLTNVVFKRGGIMGDREAMKALGEMLAAAERDGVTGFLFGNMYRDYEWQVRLWKKQTDTDPDYGNDLNKPVGTQYPGASEHQTGLALDIGSTMYDDIDERVAETLQGRWLNAHCHEYGYILRYPAGKELITGVIFEPWHFRYVGKELADYLTKHSITIEEFYRGCDLEV